MFPIFFNEGYQRLGKVRDIGSWVDPSVGGWAVRQSPRLGAGDAPLFDLPTDPRYWPNGVEEYITDRAQLKAHVKSNAGHENLIAEFI